MIESLSIPVSPSAPPLVFEGLKRVNIFVGRNGCGKSRMLDLFQHHPDLPNRALGVQTDLYFLLAHGKEEALQGARLIQPDLAGLQAFDTELWGWVGVNSPDDPALRYCLSAGGERCAFITGLIPPCAGGTFAVDDIDQSIHHSVIEPLLVLIYQLLIKYDVQLFCSLHSGEFLREALALHLHDRLDLAVYRIDAPRYKDADKYSIVRYDQQSLYAVYEGEFEIRG